MPTQRKHEPKRKSTDYPFVTPQSMAKMMEYIREPGWEHVINSKLIKKMGIAPNNEAKVPTALRFLGIIDDAGSPTKEFYELKSDYRTTIKRLVKEKYAELFSIHPAAMITRESLQAFFGKRQNDERRARFFVWLCNEAGIELPKLDKRTANN